MPPVSRRSGRRLHFAARTCSQPGRDLNSSVLELTFSGRCRYTIFPYHWTYRVALGLIESWPDLLQVADFAERRIGYGNTDSGFGLEYPTRPDRAGLVRFWRWNWRIKGRVKTRKFHFPEADYLATLAARLRQADLLGQAQAIENMHSGGLPQVQLLPEPDPYDLSNYGLRGEVCAEAFPCLRMILEQRDFALASARAAARQGFTLPDGSQLRYLSKARLGLVLHSGHNLEVAESLYLKLLELAKLYSAGG